MKSSRIVDAIPYMARAVVIGGLVTGLTYWTVADGGLHIDRAELSVWLGVIGWATAEWLLYRRAQPPKMLFTFDKEDGCWTHTLSNRAGPNPYDPKTTRICIATRREKERLPKPHHAYRIQLVGEIHCIVDNEFWVWQETFPWEETMTGVLLHPNIK